MHGVLLGQVVVAVLEDAHGVEGSGQRGRVDNLGQDLDQGLHPGPHRPRRVQHEQQQLWLAVGADVAHW